MDRPAPPPGPWRRGAASTGAFLLVAAVLLSACADPRPAGEIPGWIPLYPGSEAVLLETREGPDGVSGSLALAAAGPAEEVLGFYRQRLAAAGLRLESTPFAGPTGQHAQVTAHDGEGRRGLTVTIARVEGGTQLVINYTEAR